MTNLNVKADTTNSATTMKILATVTEKKTVEKEIELPYYCKLDEVFYCVQSENEGVKVDTTPDYTSIVKSNPTNLWLEYISQAQEITQDDFINALDLVLDRFQSTPKSLTA